MDIFFVGEYSCEKVKTIICWLLVLMIVLITIIDMYVIQHYVVYTRCSIHNYA